MRFNKLFFAVSFITCLAFSASANTSADILDLSGLLPQEGDVPQSGWDSEFSSPKIAYPTEIKKRKKKKKVTGYLNTDDIHIAQGGGLFSHRKSDSGSHVRKQIVVGSDGQLFFRSVSWPGGKAAPNPNGALTPFDKEKDAAFLRKVGFVLLHRDMNAARKVWKHYHGLELPETLEPSPTASADVTTWKAPNTVLYGAAEEEQAHGASGLPFPTRPILGAEGEESAILTSTKRNATLEDVKSMLNPKTAMEWKMGICQAEGDACQVSHPELGTLLVSGELHDFIFHMMDENDLVLPSINFGAVSQEELEEAGLYANGWKMEDGKVFLNENGQKIYRKPEVLLKSAAAEDSDIQYAIEYIGSDSCPMCDPAYRTLRKAGMEKNALVVKYMNRTSPSGKVPYVRLYKLGEEKPKVISSPGSLDSVLRAFDF